MAPHGRVASLLEAGMKAYASGRTEDARAAIEEALRLEPDHAQARSLAERLFPDALPEAGKAPSPWVEDAGLGGADLALDEARPWGFDGGAWDLPAETANPWREATPPEAADATAAEVEAGWWSAPEPRAEPPASADPPSVVWADPERGSDDELDAPTVEWTEAIPDDEEAAGWGESEAPDAPWDEAVGLAVQSEAPEAPALELLLDRGATPEAAEPAGTGDAAEEVTRLMEGARELFELADFSGSLELVQKVLTLDPANGEARDYLARNEGTLVQMYESKLGRLDRTPRVAINPDEVVWLNIDHRAGFVLAQIDGTVSYEDVFALSGMSRLDTLRILVQLVEEKVIVTD